MKPVQIEDKIFTENHYEILNAQGPVPKSPTRNWFGISDIPENLRQSSITTTVNYRLVISDKGKIVNCTAIDKSGYGLEHIVCEKIIANADFFPAIGESNLPTEGVFEGAFNITYDVKIIKKTGCGINHAADIIVRGC